MYTEIDARLPATQAQAESNHAILKKRTMQTLALTAGLLTVAALCIYSTQKCLSQPDEQLTKYWEIYNLEDRITPPVGYLKAHFNVDESFMTKFSKSAGYIFSPMTDGTMPTVKLDKEVGSLLKSSTCNTHSFFTNLTGSALQQLQSAFKSENGYLNSTDYFTGILIIGVTSAVMSPLAGFSSFVFARQARFWKQEAASLNGNPAAVPLLTTTLSSESGDIEMVQLQQNDASPRSPSTVPAFGWSDVALAALSSSPLADVPAATAVYGDDDVFRTREGFAI
ncbi:MAG: hypothetical protein P1U40_05335 [Coxiellaceae bacterium]|nr:hypothetical protein [Coxiellaceae bacterium]